MVLHWIFHNKPDLLDVQYIFDDVRVSRNGSHVGGEGKLNMYIEDVAVLKILEFPLCPHLTVLIRHLFKLFHSLARVNILDRDRIPADKDVENVDHLKDYGAIVTAMQEAAAMEDWLEIEDKMAISNYPWRVGIDPKDLVGLAYVKRVPPKQPAEPAVGIPKQPTMPAVDNPKQPVMPAVGIPQQPAKPAVGKTKAPKRGREEDRTAGVSSSAPKPKRAKVLRAP